MKVEKIDPGPTATPHLDVARKGIAIMREKMAARMREPGERGTHARIQVAMQEAYGIAVSTEREYGSEEMDIVIGVTRAMTDVLISTVGGLAHRSGNHDPQAASNTIHMLVTNILVNALQGVVQTLANSSEDSQQTILAYDTPPKPGQA